MTPIVCRRALLEEILPVRHRVLRANKPLESAFFSGDDATGTIHYAILVEKEVRGCLTMMRSSWNAMPAWQLRGMATDANMQGHGLGSQLLSFAEKDVLRENYAQVFWCNARAAAVPFYTRGGWRVVSEPFDVPQIGLHHKMLKESIQKV